MVGNLPKPFGGVATHCYNISRELSKKRIDIIFIDTHFNKEKSIPSGIKYFAVKLSAKEILQNILQPFLLVSVIQQILKFKRGAGFREIFRTIKLCLKIVGIDKKFHVDIIHSHHCLLRTTAALIAGKLRKKPVIMTVLGAEFSHDLIFRKYRCSIEYNVREVTRIICGSKFTRAKMVSRGVKRHVYVIPHGVDLDKFHPIYELVQEKSNRKNRILLTVAQLSKRKGIDILLKSTPLIKSKNVEVWIIGPPGDAVEELNNLIKRLDIGKQVVFCGQIGDDELVIRYNRADVCVLPTIWETEGFGLANLEAMSCGTPVVASRIGGIPEVVSDGETGILVTPNNPQELAHAIHDLLDNEEKRRRMGKCARERASAIFSWEKIAEMTLKVYMQCLCTDGAL